MSASHFDDSDPGNLPAIIDPTTGVGLPRDHPMVLAAARAYRNLTSLDERRAWFQVTCLNSREPAAVRKFQHVAQLIEKAIQPHG